MKKISLLLGTVLLFIFGCSKTELNLVSKKDNDDQIVLTKAECIAIQVKKKGSYEVTAEEALNRFKYFKKSIRNTDDIDIKSCILKKDHQDNNLFYEIIFENKKKNGYAIIPADERISEVLCFVNNGNLSDTLQNEGLKLFFRAINKYIKTETAKDFNVDSLYTIASNKQLSTKLSFTKSIPAFDPDVWTYVGPYSTFDTLTKLKTVPVKWGQRSPFNALVYPDPAGCSTIAVAQVMAYYKKNYKSIVDYNTWVDIVQDTSHSAIPVMIADMYSDLYWLFNSVPPFMSGVRSFLVTNGYTVGSVHSGYDFGVIFNALNYGPTIISGMENMTSGHYWIIDGVKCISIKGYDLYIYEYLNKIFEHYEMTYSFDSDYVQFNWGHYGISDGWFSSGVLACLNTGDFSSYVRILSSIQ